MKYEKLSELLAAVQSKVEPVEGLKVRVYNDHAHAERCTGPVDKFGDHETIVELWSGESPADILVALLTALGVPAVRA